jgi:hypothetical protein
LGKHESLSHMSEKPILINSKTERVDVEALIDRCRSDPNRILADDEVGLVVYVGDLDIYSVSALGHPATGNPSPDPSGHWAQKVNEISVIRFGESVRRQIGSVVKTLSADSVLLIRDGDSLRKVRAADLKPGMILRSGEKVYW